MKVQEYRDVPNNSLFTVLRGEKVGQNYIKNEGIFIKIGNSHAIAVRDKKDAIFSLRTPCRVVNSNVRIDMSKIPGIGVSNRGNPGLGGK